MTRTWLAIQVDHVEGRGKTFWPRPGRIFAAARGRTFAQLATAIDDAFARWDRAHLMQFELADGTRLQRPDWDEESEGDDARKLRLSRLSFGEQFTYEFDFARLLDPPVHRRPAARRSPRGARRGAGPSDAVLGVG